MRFWIRRLSSGSTTSDQSSCFEDLDLDEDLELDLELDDLLLSRCFSWRRSDISLFDPEELEEDFDLVLSGGSILILGILGRWTKESPSIGLLCTLLELSVCDGVADIYHARKNQGDRKVLQAIAVECDQELL